MLCKLYLESNIRDVVPIKNSQLILKNVESVENGSIVSKSCFVSSSVYDDYGAFMSSDFSLSNVIALGKLSQLNRVSMENHDFVSSAAAIDNLAKIGNDVQEK